MKCIPGASHIGAIRPLVHTTRGLPLEGCVEVSLLLTTPEPRLG